MYKKPSLPKQVLIYIGMTVVALIFMFPLIWMIVSSFKDDAMIFSDITSLKAFAPAFKEDVSCKSNAEFTVIYYSHHCFGTDRKFYGRLCICQIKIPKEKSAFCTDPGSYDHSGSDSYASAVLYYL